MIELVDMGGLNLTFRYIVEQEDLNDYGEIFSSGVRIFINANVINQAGDLVFERDYLRNDGNIIFYSILRYDQPSIFTKVERFDTTTGEADISLTNLSMNAANLEGYRLVAVLYSANNTAIEVKSLTIPGTLGREDTRPPRKLFIKNIKKSKMVKG